MMVIMCLETVMAKVRSRASDNAIRLMTQTLEVAKLWRLLPLHSILRPPEKHKQSVYSPCPCRIQGNSSVLCLGTQVRISLFMSSCIMASKFKINPVYFI